MIRIDENLQVVVVVVTQGKQGCSFYIPDFNVTVHGIDLLEAQANAITYASAIYYYNVERNVEFKLDATYESAHKHCKTKKSFVTFIPLTK